jgi:hypothetical protein
MMAGLATGGSAAVAGLTAGVMESGADYEELKREGVAADEAFARAAVGVAAIGMLNAAGFGPVFKKGSPVNPVSRFLKRFVAEGTSEYIEEPTQLTTREAGRLPADEFMEKLARTLKDAVDVIPVAGVMGGAGGVLSDAMEKDSSEAVGVTLFDPAAMSKWVAENPEKAAALADKAEPSRKDWAAAGLPRMPAAERKSMTDAIRDVLTKKPVAVETPEQAAARKANEELAAAKPPEPKEEAASVPAGAPPAAKGAEAQAEVPAGEGAPVAAAGE